MDQLGGNNKDEEDVDRAKSNKMNIFVAQADM